MNDINNMKIFNLSIEDKRLSKLLSDVEQRMYNLPNADVFLIEELEDLKKQVEFMNMYAHAEKKDPFRQEVFDKITAGLTKLSRDIVKCSKVEAVPELRAMKKRAPEGDFELSSVRRNLESYVSSLAMAELMSPDSDNKDDVVDQHFSYIEKLFNHIVTGRLWNDAQRTFYTETLLSPVTDTNDALVLVSAITVSTLLVMDELKIEALLDIYSGTNVPELRERALVGWVMAMHSAGGHCQRVEQKINALFEKNDVMEHLLELQMQIFYCAEAEKDNDTIQRDIMPKIVNNKNLNINRFGIIEKDEDDINDILNPGDADKAMQDIEKSMDRIKDMQRKGADVYFGGFARMKRFAFFSSMVNWFYPYMDNHPGLRSVNATLNGSKLLSTVVGSCPFCNSDKYSFALGMSSVYAQLPDEVKQMLGSDEMFKMEMADTNEGTPSYMRRMYLQDMYRFFKLNDSRTSMDNMFGERNGLMRGFFFDDIYLNRKEMISAKKSLARFLLKKRAEGSELELLFGSYTCDDTNDKITRAKYLYSRGTVADTRKALELYREVYASGNSRDAAVNGMSRCLTELGDNEEACRYSGILAEENPDNYNYLLSHAILLIKCDRPEEANNILFKLNYERPEDMNVMRVLAWCLLMEDKNDKAEALYAKIMKERGVSSSDYLNAGFSKWVSGKEDAAADMFAQYVRKKGITSLAREIEEEGRFLQRHDIKEVDMCMMLDWAEERTK